MIERKSNQTFLVPMFVYLLFMVLISYGVHPFQEGVLNYNDGVYAWPSSDFNFLTTWHRGDLGYPFIAQSFVAFLYLPNILTEFLFDFPNGDSYQAFTLYFMPIYVCCLAVFALARRVSGNVMFAYFSGFFIIFNNFILEQLIIWPVSYFYSLAGFLLQVYILWRIYDEEVSLLKGVMFVLAALLIHHPLMFFISFLYALVFLLFIFAQQRIKLRYVVLLLFGMIIIQSYWVIPFVYTFLATSVSEIHMSSGESAYAGYLYTINYRNLFNMLNYPLNMDRELFEIVHNKKQLVFNYFILSLIVVMFMTIGLKEIQKSSRILLLFCLFMYLFFFNMTLGPNSVVTGSLWSWAYDNIPGFAFLRSFNRFYIVVVVVIILLLGSLFKNTRFKHKSLLSFILIVLNFSSFNIMFSGTLDGLAVRLKIPEEYYEANEKYFRYDNEAVTLSLPHVPYESYGWVANDSSYFSNTSMYFLDYFTGAPLITNRYSNQLDKQYPDLGNSLDFYYQTTPFDAASDVAIKSMGVKYVMINKDRIDILRKNQMIVSWQLVDKYFAGNENYIMREQNEFFSLYEVRNNQAIISGNYISYSAVSDTKYKITVNDMQDVRNIKFAQRFHSGWRLYHDDSERGELNDSNYGLEAVHKKNNLFWEDLKFLFMVPALDEGSHYLVDSYANEWVIAPAPLSNGSHSEKGNFILYFRPQAFFTFGVVVSLFVVLVCFTTILLGLVKRRVITQKVG